MRRYTYNYSMERFEIDEEGYWCKWEDVAELNKKYEDLKRHYAEDTCNLEEERDRYREALETIVEDGLGDYYGHHYAVIASRASEGTR